ncbi:hypothetical protein FRC03_003430 [Tulasnella sp. 419]|nr:hypothetical protein FRC02_009909 [Tulasnella sp. 418]KAG8969329.1 hypothetical protein FRC03_003430 [Tulasnella sp. 419]
MATDLSSDTVRATLNYFVPPQDGSKPYTDINGPPAVPGQDSDPKHRNWKAVSVEFDVHNLRGNVHIPSVDELAQDIGNHPGANEMSLDATGFQFLSHPTTLSAEDFDDDDKVRQVYYDEIIEFIKKVTGANRAIIFDHTVRRNQASLTETDPKHRQPVPIVHVDQTPGSAERRLRRHAPPELIPELLSKRYQIINVWRPIENPAFDYPLTVCDYRTVDADRDLVATTLKYPDGKDGETFNVREDKGHKWVYLKGIQPDEALLIKCYDTIRDGKTAVFTPHSAFKDPSAPKDAPLRQSIEARVLVFYP